MALTFPLIIESQVTQRDGSVNSVFIQDQGELDAFLTELNLNVEDAFRSHFDTDARGTDLVTDLEAGDLALHATLDFHNPDDQNNPLEVSVYHVDFSSAGQSIPGYEVPFNSLAGTFYINVLEPTLVDFSAAQQEALGMEGAESSLPANSFWSLVSLSEEGANNFERAPEHATLAPVVSK